MPTRRSLPPARLRPEALEDRATPAAPDDGLTVAVGFRTSDPADPVAVRVEAVPDGRTADETAAAWRWTPGVAYAEPNFTVEAARLPNDPRFAELYALHNTGQSGGRADADIDAPEAWDITTGSPKTVVAVIDTGVDYTHRDLYLNVWINQAEIPAAVRSALTDVDGDGVITFYDLNEPANIGAGKITDLNGTGYIDGGDLLRTTAQGGWADGVDAGPLGSNGQVYRDDLIGWDFVGNDNDPMDLLSQNGGHGTHVAGTIGAVGDNGVGVVGVAWRARLMPLRFLGTNGGSTTNAALAVRYSANNGAAVSNNSWGGGGFSQTLYDAIAFARTRNGVFVAAAGNAGANSDVTAAYPASYALDNVVAVASTTRTDARSSFSNYGRTAVDLGAPGSDILSTYPGNGYAVLSGTSMAAPQVAGALALVVSQTPSIGYADAIARVLNNVDPVAALATTTVTGGRLNVAKAVAAGANDVTGPWVTGMAANASGTSPVSAVRVTFGEAVDAATLTPADVAVTAPGGGAVAVAAVTPVGTAGTQFDVTFASQSAAGTYTVTVGPDVADGAGNRMDQDRDGTNGEPTQDRFAGTFVITAAGSYKIATVSNTTQVTIADRATTVSRLTVNQDLEVADLNVLVNLTHTYVSDLAVSLRGPDGTTVRLFGNRGGSGDNLSSTTFNDEATRTIASGAAPFAGSFKPEEVLSAFDGKNARGVWELRVVDSVRYDTGRLRNWSLVITTGTPPGGQSVGPQGFRAAEPAAVAAPKVAPDGVWLAPGAGWGVEVDADPAPAGRRR